MKIGGKKENSILGCFYHKLDHKCPQTERTLPPHVVVNAERRKSLFLGRFFVFVSELLPGMVINYCKQHFFKRVLLKNHGSFQFAQLEVTDSIEQPLYKKIKPKKTKNKHMVFN